MAKEKKCYQLQPRTHVRKLNPVISNVALVIDEDGPGYCYFSFAEPFVLHVGKKMPRGVTTFDPVFLRVSRGRDIWKVEAVYDRDGVAEELWTAQSRPEWVKQIRREKKNGDYAGKKAGSGRQDAEAGSYRH